MYDRPMIRPSAWFRALAQLPTSVRACLAVVLSTMFGMHCMCANWEYSRAYEAHVAQEVDAYRHAGTPAEVVTGVIGLLSDRGYVVQDPGVVETIETEWKGNGAEHRDRYRVTLSTSAEGIMVRATTIAEALSPQDWAPERRTPAAELERALLVAVRPELAETMSDAELRTHGYTTAPSVLWDALQRAAAEAGTGFDSYEPPIDAVAVTPWLSERAESRWRYEARFDREGGNQTRVTIDRAVEKAVGERTWVPQGETRDLQLERALIERRDPERAASIEQVASDKAQAAFDEALSRGAPACGGCQACAPL
jgi:hypothetical protein